jgi:hypothetical protein
MSAFIVNNKTINLILNYAYNIEKYECVYINGDLFYLSNDKDCQTIGETLLNENIYSVNYRYDSNYTQNFKFERQKNLIITPFVALNAIACLEYQSCETENWEKSEAYHICNQFRKTICSNLIGYNDVSWRDF